MTTTEANTIVVNKQQLIDYFQQGSKPPERWGIGTEHEKFLFHKTSLKRLSYNDGNGILAIFNRMKADGWQPVNEGNDVIALRKNGASITLEPGGQFELSGENITTVKETFEETRMHFEELTAICREYGFFSLPIGVDPLTPLAEVPWMPKERYRYMKNHMPNVGTLGLEMMTNTACIQVNLDYSDEADMVKKMRVAQALQPVVTAIFANSPFSLGKPNGFLSYRAHIWDNTDPARTGFLPFIFDRDFGFERWVDYLLDVPMYFIFRNGSYKSARGLTFREYLDEGHGTQATLEDWEIHVSTVFPDVRLKQFIEMRGADASCVSHIAALSALWVGLLYDAQSLEEAYQLIAPWDISAMQELRAQVPVKALNAASGNLHAGSIARQICSIASNGLTRRSRARGIENEKKYMAPACAITDSGVTQAEKLLQLYKEDFNSNLPDFIYNWQRQQLQRYL